MKLGCLWLIDVTHIIPEKKNDLHNVDDEKFILLWHLNKGFIIIIIIIIIIIDVLRTC